MALIPSDPKQRNALLVIVVALAGLYAFYEYFYTPRANELTELELRVESLEDRNRVARATAARGGADLEERLTVYERHIRQLEQLIPRGEEVPALLNSITNEARIARVSLNSIQPEGTQPGDFYSRQSYAISVLGSFHDVGRFLTAVASLPRIVTPVDMEITPFTGQADLVGIVDPILATFRIETFIVTQPREGEATAMEDAS
ncbi:MAG: type 4a pilus biogenesis protein PilO [Gemmatimonadota bacterium]